MTIQLREWSSNARKLFSVFFSLRAVRFGSGTETRGCL
jgi:hypothetical protein